MRSIISVIHTLYIVITQSFTLHLLSFSVSVVSSLVHPQAVPLPSFSSLAAVWIPVLVPLLSSFLSFSSFPWSPVLALVPLLVHHFLPSFVVSVFSSQTLVLVLVPERVLVPEWVPSFSSFLSSFSSSHPLWERPCSFSPSLHP